MKSGRIATATGLLSLFSLPAVSALPAENLWRPLGETFVFIWPQYAGNVAHLIDAILLFMIIAMTVVEASKKTKLPSATGWGVGIALWMVTVFALRGTGKLLFEHVLFAFLGFFITLVVFIRLIKSVLDYIISDKLSGSKWFVSTCLALLGVGSLFGSVLQQLEVTGSESFLYTLMVASISLAAPLLVIGIIYLVIKASSGKSLFSNRRKKSTSSYEKLRKEQEKENKQKEELKNDQELETQHDEYLKRVEGQLETFSQKMQELDAKAEQTVRGVEEYAEALVAYAEKFEKNVIAYRNWMDQEKTSLPDQYITRIEQIVAEWRNRVDKLKALLDELRSDRESISSEDIEKFENALKSEISAHRQLFSKFAEVKAQIDDLDTAAQRLANTTLTTDKKLFSQMQNECPKFSQLYAGVTDVQKHVEKMREKLDKREELIIKENKQIAQNLKNCEDALERFEESSENSKTIIEQLKKYLEDAISNVQASVKNMDKKQMQAALSNFKSFRKEVSVEKNEIGVRSSQETILRKNHEAATKLIDEYEKQYGEEIRELHDYMLASQQKLAYAESLEGLKDALQAIETSIAAKKVHDWGQEKLAVQQQLEKFKQNTQKLVDPIRIQNPAEAKKWTQLVDEALDELLGFYEKRFKQLADAVRDIGGNKQ